VSPARTAKERRASSLNALPAAASALFRGTTPGIDHAACTASMYRLISLRSIDQAVPALSPLHSFSPLWRGHCV
jgi:hypothetical protein